MIRQTSSTGLQVVSVPSLELSVGIFKKVKCHEWDRSRSFPAALAQATITGIHHCSLIINIQYVNPPAVALIVHHMRLLLPCTIPILQDR